MQSYRDSRFSPRRVRFHRNTAAKDVDRNLSNLGVILRDPGDIGAIVVTVAEKFSWKCSNILIPPPAIAAADKKFARIVHPDNSNYQQHNAAYMRNLHLFVGYYSLQTVCISLMYFEKQLLKKIRMYDIQLKCLTISHFYYKFRDNFFVARIFNNKNWDFY